MPLTLAQLTKVVTEEEALELLLGELQALKINARAWQEGSVPLTLVRVFARTYANFTEVVRQLTEAGFNETSTGEFLDLFSKSHYRNGRKPAVSTEGLVRMTASSTSPGPFSFGASELVFADSITGQAFRNVDPGLINANESVDLLVRAEAPGSVGDVATNTITVMRTPLAGVSADNPLPSGATSWITKNGSDVESDEALRERNASKWGSLGIGSPALAYQHWALEAHESVRRVWVDDQNPRGPDSLDVYIAGDAGAISSVAVEAVNTFFTGDVDGLRRVAFGADLQVKSANRLDLPLRGTVYIQSSYNTRATQLEVVRRLRDYFKLLPIGGTRITVDAAGRVILGELFRAMLSVTGVRNVQFTSPQADREVRANQVVVPVMQFGYVSV